MTSKYQNKKAINRSKTLKYIGLVIYILTIIISSVLLVVEPAGFNPITLIPLSVTLMIIGSLGFSYPITLDAQSKSVVWGGTVLLAIMFAFLGFFAIAAVGWFIGVSHT
jgi:hypothetical protein